MPRRLPTGEAARALGFSASCTFPLERSSDPLVAERQVDAMAATDRQGKSSGIDVTSTTTVRAGGSSRVFSSAFDDSF